MYFRWLYGFIFIAQYCTLLVNSKMYGWNLAKVASPLKYILHHYDLMETFSK